MRYADACKVGDFGFSSVPLVKTVLACFRSLLNSFFNSKPPFGRTMTSTVIAPQQERCANAKAKSEAGVHAKPLYPCKSPILHVEMHMWCLTSGFVRRIDPSLEERGAKTYQPLMQSADSYSKDLHL